jgi:regulator of replication initiation timing
VFDFNFHVDADVSALEKQMSELIAKVDEIKAGLAAEAEQAKALVAKVDELKAKVDVLLSDTYAKAEVNAAFDEIKSLLPGVVPDAPVE